MPVPRFARARFGTLIAAVRLAKGGRVVNGIGADTDIVVASAKAYLSALNRLASKVERLNPQHQL